MAKLYFRHGAMGSSKTANALMVEYNYYERGKKALLLKPGIDDRDGAHIIKSRMGLEHKCGSVEEFVKLSDDEIRKYDCIIVDEAQFCTKEQIRFFLHVVDHLHIPVICYGLRTDFQRELFPGSMWLLAWADVIEEIRTVCWCGQGACCNARISPEGKVIRSGEQVVLGGNDTYIALCRKHYEEGNIGKGTPLTEQFFAANRSETDLPPEDIASDDTLPDPDEGDYLDDDDPIDPQLVEFLDAETYEEKINLFKLMSRDIDDETINTIAAALELEIAPGPIDRRVDDVMNCLTMMRKFECNRLR